MCQDIENRNVAVYTNLHYMARVRHIAPSACLYKRARHPGVHKLLFVIIKRKILCEAFTILISWWRSSATTRARIILSGSASKRSIYLSGVIFFHWRIESQPIVYLDLVIMSLY